MVGGGEKRRILLLIIKCTFTEAIAICREGGDGQGQQEEEEEAGDKTIITAD